MGEGLLLLYLGMAMVTYFPRFFPLFILTRVKIPRSLAVWLGYVPVAVLAALVAPGLLLEEGQLFLSPRNSFLLASVPTFAAALKTRSMFLTVLAGMICILFFNFFT